MTKGRRELPYREDIEEAKRWIDEIEYVTRENRWKQERVAF